METRKIQLQEKWRRLEELRQEREKYQNRDVGKTKVTDFLDCKCVYNAFFSKELLTLLARSLGSYIFFAIVYKFLWKRKKTIRIDRKKSEFMKNTLWQSFLCLFNEDNNPEEIREEKRRIKKVCFNLGCFGLSRHLSCFLLLFFLISVLLPTRFPFPQAMRPQKKFLQQVSM